MSAAQAPRPPPVEAPMPSAQVQAAPSRTVAEVVDDITVAVAACGRPASLLRCLEGLGRGSALPGEVVVVDQAPSSAARRAIERAAIHVHYIEQPRLGLSASRNLALAQASRRILAVTDDDCVPDPGWLAAVARAFGPAPAPAAVTGPIRPLGPRPPGAFAISLRVSPEPTDYLGRIPPWHVGSGANFAATRDVLLSLGGWDERLGVGSPGLAAEDADLIYRLLRADNVIRYEPAAVVRHEWQLRDRRLATRWSYGYGIGAMCGLGLARRDPYALRMLSAYARIHAAPLARAVRRRQRSPADEHARALVSLGPGLLYGLRASRSRRDDGRA